MATRPLKKRCTSIMTLYYFSFLMKPWGEFSPVCFCFNGEKRMGAGIKAGEMPYEETIPGIFINKLPGGRGMKGALCFVRARCPPEII